MSIEDDAKEIQTIWDVMWKVADDDNVSEREYLALFEEWNRLQDKFFHTYGILPFSIDLLPIDYQNKRYKPISYPS